MIAAGFFLASIVSLGSWWQFCIFTGVFLIALLGAYLRSCLISSTLAGVIISPFFGAVNGNGVSDLAHALTGAICGAVAGGILDLIGRSSGKPPIPGA